MRTDRRNFCKLSVLGGASVSMLGCAPAPRAVATVGDQGIELSLAENPSLAEPGGQVSVTAGDRRVLIARVDEATYAAVDQHCTHRGCSVAWKGEGSEFKCPCHGSTFAMDGKVTKGPAKEDLARFEVQVEGDALRVALS